MAGIRNVATPTTNTILQGLEGTPVWDAGTLTYSFATSADAGRSQDEFDSRGRAGTLNYLDTSDADDAKQRDEAVEAFDSISRVAAIDFSLSSDFDTADFKILGVDGYDLAGQSTFPGTNLQQLSLTDYESWNFFNTSSFWTAADATHGREVGGSGFMLYTTIHEFLHGMGVAHPHDAGHGSTAFADVGRVTFDNPLDNERYTTLSYERGGVDANFGNSFGHAGTPMVLDIATLQNMYGINTTTHDTATTYALTDRASAAYDPDGSDGSVSIGRSYYGIWDTGGIDEIDYDGTERTLINLNTATLDQGEDPVLEALLGEVRQAANYHDLPDEFTYDFEGNGTFDASDYYAGGFFSRVFDTDVIYDAGGYAIAAGAVIENASGADSGDFLIGNAIANALSGEGGDDYINGAAGDDTIDGGAGDDEMRGGAGDDAIDGGAGTEDVAVFSEACRNYTITRDDATGQVTIEHVSGSMVDGTDTLVNVENARFADATIDLTAAEIDDCPPLDFIFLVDLSGSFFDDLPNFVASAQAIAANLRAENPDVQFSVASFIDKPESPFGSPGDYLYNADLPLTASATELETALAGLSTRSGGDFPEAQYVGLWRAANGVGLNLREGSSRVIYLATDAPAHTASDYGLDEDTILDFLENEGIAVVEGSPDVAPTALVSSDESVVAAPADDQQGSGTPDDNIEPGVDPDGDGHGFVADRPAPDAIIGALSEVFRDLSATPIIGVSGSSSTRDAYSAALVEAGSSGVVIETSRDSSDVADAVRAGLAEITGDVTETGTSGDDILTGTPEADVLLGLGGNDTIDGLGGNDRLDGGSGDDTVTGGDGDDVLFGGTGGDTLDGGDGDDTIDPGTGFDTMTGGAGADLFSGVSDALDGNIITDFDPGIDRIVVRGEEITSATILPGDVERLEIVTSTGTISIELPFTGITEPVALEVFFDGTDTFVGSDPRPGGIGLTDGDDRFVTVNDGDDEVFAGGGNDVVLGGGGGDTLGGGAGDDVLNGGDGDDVLIGGRGGDTLTGGDGQDIFVQVEGAGGGVDFIEDFDLDDDEISFAGFSSVASFDDLVITDTESGARVDYGDGQTLLLRNIDAGDLTGTAFRFGSDVPEAPGVIAPLVALTDAGDRFITRDEGSNRIDGQSGNDVIVSAGGDDLLIGGSGGDNLKGGDGEDRLIGGANGDTLTGGADADTFAFDGAEDIGADFITDFTIGEDRVEISGFDGLDGFDDLAIADASSGDAVLTLRDGEVVVFTGVSSADLGVDDFVFTGADDLIFA